MTTATFTLTKRPTSDEIVRAWHQGWWVHDEVNTDRAGAIARCPYPSGRLRREYIAGWDYAEMLEHQDATILEYEEREAGEWGAEPVCSCGID